MGLKYEIESTPEFEKQINKLIIRDKSLAERVLNKIKELEDNPERFKHLKYNLKDYCRLRINKIRVLFNINKKDKKVILQAIIFGHKYLK